MVQIEMFLGIDAINISSRSENKCKKQKSQYGWKSQLIGSVHLLNQLTNEKTKLTQ
jgi:hypothetical protein